METKLSEGSAALAGLAHRLGVSVQKPVSFDVRTHHFYGVNDAPGKRGAIDEGHLNWLLDLGQRNTLSPDDEAMVASFVWAHTRALPRLDKLQNIAGEAILAVRRFVVDRTPIEFSLVGAHRVVSWSGQVTMPSIFARDWDTAFWLRVADLAADYGDRVRVCRRPDCCRLFFAADARQVFCSRACSQRTQFENYVKKIGGEENRRKQQRQQYRRRRVTGRRSKGR